MSHCQTASEESHPKIVAVVPAYNERQHIKRIVSETQQYVDTVVVVDDGSRDGTGDLAEEAGAVVVRHGRNLGKGAAVNSGFAKARELGADAVVLLDADGQHDPADIPKVMRPVLAGEADMVVGSRFLGLKSRIPFHRRFGQWLFNLLINLGSGVPSSDTLSGYRAFSRAALESLHLAEAGWGLEAELQFQTRRRGLVVTEVPIFVSYERDEKHSPLRQGLQIIDTLIRLVTQYRPLLFFGSSGVLLMGMGLAAGAWVVHRFNTIRILPIGTSLLCLLLLILGALTFFTGIILHSIRALLVQLLGPGRVGPRKDIEAHR